MLFLILSNRHIVLKNIPDRPQHFLQSTKLLLFHCSQLFLLSLKELDLFNFLFTLILPFRGLFHLFNFLLYYIFRFSALIQLELSYNELLLSKLMWGCTFDPLFIFSYDFVNDGGITETILLGFPYFVRVSALRNYLEEVWLVTFVFSEKIYV